MSEAIYRTIGVVVLYGFPASLCIVLALFTGCMLLLGPFCALPRPKLWRVLFEVGAGIAIPCYLAWHLVAEMRAALAAP